MALFSELFVKDKSFDRTAIRQLSSLKRQAEEGVIDNPIAFLRKTENAVTELEQAVREKQDPHASAIFNDIKKNWQEENEGIRVYTSNDSKLDTAIPQDVPGHLLAAGRYISIERSTFTLKNIRNGPQHSILSKKKKKEINFITLFRILLEKFQQWLGIVKEKGD
jgi:hypothetical protein